MYDVEEIIHWLHHHFKLSFSVERKLKKKNTARALQKYLLSDETGKKYLLEIATNRIAHFYLQRSIEYQTKFSKFKHGFKLNFPLYTKLGENLSFVVYSYDELFSMENSLEPVKLLKQFYSNYSVEVTMTDVVVHRILTSFLSAWPKRYHPMIKRQRLYREYQATLQRYRSVKIAFEHGDFTRNNLITIGDHTYLIDFEFSREYQPIGFDIYDYARSVHSQAGCRQSYYEDLHAIKYNLVETVNCKIDNQETDIEIFDNFEDEVLQAAWSRLYRQNAPYNLSLYWCRYWARSFLKHNAELYIITLWKGDQPVLLAPLYKVRKRLYLIGSNPDLFDTFSFLYTDPTYLKQLYQYIFKHQFEIDFRYLDSESDVAKLLMKYLYQDQIAYESQVVDTNPTIDFNTFRINAKEKSDVKRCKNRVSHIYNSLPVFQSDVTITEQVINDFISMHKRQWDGGPFEYLEGFDRFIKQVSEAGLVQLSRLVMGEETLAYHLAYKNANGSLTSAIPAYNKSFSDISPGKILLYDLISLVQSKGDAVFDFGRGGEAYKYWFANKSTILFHVQTYQQGSFFVKMYHIVTRMFSKVYRMWYA